MTDTLDKLKKAFEQAISTATAVQPWNEPLTRRDSVQAGQVFSGPVVQGGLGSWVASSGFPYTGTSLDGVQTGDQPPARNSFEMALGLPGVPDVDFVPYTAGTNRFGGKGPSLIGHPISWEVVGPTLKSPYCDWQWHVDTSGPSNDVLTLEAGPYPMPGSVLPVSIADAYGVGPDFNDLGGLYVLFTFTGENFDGSLTGGRTPIFPFYKYRAPFELFRVDSFDAPALSIVLRGEKRVSTYYGAGDGCRAITLIRPKVTRLAGLPVPVLGQAQANRTFVFLPPETSATSEYAPPFNTAGTGSWATGGFDPSGVLPAGNPLHYGTASKIPVPKPLKQINALIPTALIPPTYADEWQVQVAALDPLLVPGRIVRVSSLTDSIPSDIDPNTGSASNAFGYFEIGSITPGVPNTLHLRRVTEADPDTGATFFGAGPTTVAVSVPVKLEIHDNISSIFLDARLNMEKVASARLVNLIDPRTSGPSVEYRDTASSPVPASKPDKAIFNTKAGANPGNLLELGFRVVLFPARQAFPGGDAIPDFDKPIDSNEVVLDPNVSDRQYIEIDYAAGVAYLSHAPDAGNPACQVTPNGFGPILTAPNNPRQEVVLFAACVPYSTEAGQTEPGVRIMGSSPDSVENGFGANDFADVFGRRIITEANGLQTLDPLVPANATVTTTLTDLKEIPYSGFFFVGYALPGSTMTGRVGPYYYQYTDLNAGQVRLNGITGPGGPVILDPALPDGSKIVLQRSLRAFTPAVSASDTVRGASKRVGTLAFRNTDVSFGADGTVTITPTAIGYSLDDAYRKGLSTSPGAGRVVVSDGGPVEARPDGSSDDPTLESGFESQFLSRYDLGSDLTVNKVGFDSIGRRGTIPYSDEDNYAGFVDRRILAPQSGYTILGTGASYTFDINTLGTDEISVTTGGNQFHDGGGTNRTLLVNNLDLIHIPGYGIYVFHLRVAGVATNYLIRNLDGSVPALAAAAVTGCTAYRPRFFTGRGFDGAFPITGMGGTWITGQGSKPALRLYAGSGTVQGGPDDGGSTHALEFWYRRGDTTPASSVSFDTYGRLFGSGLALSSGDQALRGPYLTRLRRDPVLGGSAFGLGHVTETSVGIGAPVRSYDFLSLRVGTMGTVATGTFPYTVFSADEIDVTGGAGFTHRRLSLFGGSMVDIVAYTGTGDYLGLYKITETSSPAPNTARLKLVKLDNTAPALTVAATGSVQVHTAAYTGFGFDNYHDFAGVLQSHNPTSVVGVGGLNNSTGIHVAGPDAGVVTGGVAIRATALSGPFPTGRQFEIFRVDLTGKVQALDDIESMAGDIIAAGDFLYTAPVNRTSTIPLQGGTPETTGAGVSEWDYNPFGIPVWTPRTFGKEIHFPIKVPRGAQITSIEVLVNPAFARPGSGFLVAIHQWNMTWVGAPPPAPSSSPILLVGPATWVLDDGTANRQVLVLTPNAPLVISDTDEESYYLRIAAPSAGAGLTTTDRLEGIRVNFTDPGPRNY